MGVTQFVGVGRIRYVSAKLPLKAIESEFKSAPFELVRDDVQRRILHSITQEEFPKT